MKRKSTNTSLTIAYGAAVGAAMGSATHHMAGWVAIGVAVGVAIAFAAGSNYARNCGGTSDDKLNPPTN